MQNERLARRNLGLPVTAQALGGQVGQMPASKPPLATQPGEHGAAGPRWAASGRNAPAGRRSTQLVLGAAA